MVETPSAVRISTDPMERKHNVNNVFKDRAYLVRVGGSIIYTKSTCPLNKLSVIDMRSY